MTKIPINNIGLVGINRDLPTDTLPPEVWTAGENVRFVDNAVVKFKGDTPVFDPPSVPPYWTMAVQTTGKLFWLYMGLDKAYNFEGSTHTNITRASGDYTGTIDSYWDGGILGGIPVVNNGVDVPQMWDASSASNLLVDLPNWTAATVAKIVKPFRNFLVSMNIVEGGIDKPHMVWWSHSADPGTIPNSWDVTDPTKDAGRFELTDVNAGIIQDGLMLGDIFIIYKDNATHGMQFIGGTFIFRRFNIFTATGILAQRCATVLPVVQGRQSMHFVATGDDIIVHDGRSATSVLNKRMQKFLNTTLDTTNFTRSYTTLNIRKNEAWFCFPESGATHPSLAIVWNYVDGSLGVRNLNEAAFIAPGVISETTSAPWSSASGTWAANSEAWGTRQFNPQDLDLLQCDPTNTKFLHIDQTDQFNGVNMDSRIERTGLAVVGQDRLGNPIVDITRRKLLKRIWIRATGGPIEVSAGSQEKIGGAVTWQPSQTFTPGTDNYLDFTANGLLLAVKFETAGNVAWTLSGYDIEVEMLGES